MRERDFRSFFKYLGGGLVALLHRLIEGLLLEGDLTALLKVLLADLLLGRLELGHIGEVALLGVLVGALQDGILLEGGHLLLLVDTAEASVGVILAGAEVNAAGHCVSPVPPDGTMMLGNSRTNNSQHNKGLQ